MIHHFNIFWCRTYSKRDRFSHTKIIFNWINNFFCGLLKWLIIVFLVNVQVTNWLSFQQILYFQIKQIMMIINFIKILYINKLRQMNLFVVYYMLMLIMCRNLIKYIRLLDYFGSSFSTGQTFDEALCFPCCPDEITFLYIRVASDAPPWPAFD